MANTFDFIVVGGKSDPASGLYRHWLEGTQGGLPDVLLQTALRILNLHQKFFFSKPAEVMMI